MASDCKNLSRIEVEQCLQDLYPQFEIKVNEKNSQLQYDGQQSQYDGQQSQYDGQQSQYDGQQSQYDGQQSQYDGQQSQYDGQQSQYDGQQSQYDGQQSQYDGQQSQYDGQHNNPIIKNKNIKSLKKDSIYNDELTKKIKNLCNPLVKDLNQATDIDIKNKIKKDLEECRNTSKRYLKTRIVK
jgi:hypothetical protein